MKNNYIFYAILFTFFSNLLIAQTEKYETTFWGYASCVEKSECAPFIWVGSIVTYSTENKDEDFAKDMEEHLLQEMKDEVPCKCNNSSGTILKKYTSKDEATKQKFKFITETQNRDLKVYYNNKNLNIMSFNPPPFKMSLENPPPELENSVNSMKLQSSINIIKTGNYDKAFIILERLVKKKFSPSYYWAGTLYLQGMGVKKDLVKARELFQKGALTRDPEALFIMGELMWRGEVFALDKKRGLKNIEEAYKFGHSGATKFLFNNTEGGNKLLKSLDLLDEGNENEAFIMTKEAAEEGFKPAFLFLGLMYIMGEGTPIDISVARTWLRKSSNWGDVNGMGALGQLEIDQRNFEEGKKILRQAAKAGSQLAIEILKEYENN